MSKEMSPAEVKENIGFIPEIKKALDELKALFSSEKVEVKAEAVVEETKAEVKEELKADDYTKNFNEFKTNSEAKFSSYEEKFTAFEAQIKTANDTITKQDEQLKKMFSVIEVLTNKFNEFPTALSKQAKKEGVKEAPKEMKVGLSVWE